MPTRVVQTSQEHAAGEIDFRIDGPLVKRLGDCDSLELAIVHSSSGNRFLHINSPNEPWKAQSGTFDPEAVRFEGASVMVKVGHRVTFHLKPNVPYRLQLRLSSGEWVEEFFTVPATVRLLSSPPDGWREAAPDVNLMQGRSLPETSAALTTGAAASTAPSPDDSAPQALPGIPPTEETIQASGTPPAESNFTPAPAQSTDADEKAKGSKGLIAAVGLFIVGLIALASWWFSGQSKPNGPATVDACRQELMQSPSAEQARESALALAKASRLLDCQFLLLKYAATKGDAVSARILGTFYDPETWSKSTSPLPEPNAAEAARWHRQAAEAGELDSIYRYAMLLKLGRTEEADAPEKAQTLLKAAADKGHPLAKAEISR
jgi:hypothetical protein